MLIVYFHIISLHKNTEIKYLLGSALVKML